MIKNITSLLCGLLMTTLAMAQLPTGSIAPDFTATDIEGNQWNLYELLDEGKTVILDVSATWCGPCWDYHTGGTLDQLYDMYGPDGTDEMRIFMIEGDEDTSLDCLYGNCGNTLGDWVTGTHYPIIDNSGLADLYEITYYPTLYHICPSRIVTEFDQVSAAEIYSINGTCQPAFGANNMGALSYTGESGTFCRMGDFTPSALLQNLGTENITSAEVELRIDGNTVETKSWTGDISTFQIVNVEFDAVTITESTDFEIEVVSVNGNKDDDDTNNLLTASTLLALEAADNNLTLEILTDAYPIETYWEIVNENGVAIYTGGNAQVVGGANNYSDLEISTLHTYDLPLPVDGCYEFRIYDGFGDGINDPDNGLGYFKLLDANGMVIVEGGQFEAEDFQPFGAQTGTQTDNASIVDYSGESGNFCFDYSYMPQLTIQNVGNNEITTMDIEVSDFIGGTQNVHTWTGSIASGGYGFINDIPQVDMDQTTIITFTILSVNGSDDVEAYKNDFAASFERKSSKTASYLLELQLDDFGYEAYWEMVNSAGDVIASGGNEVVRDSGGGAQVAADTDPGAYGANELVQVFIPMPNETDCYNLRILDDWGDGALSLFSAGSLTLYDEDANVIYDQSLGFFYSELDNPVGNEGLSSVNELDEVESVTLFPNPANNSIRVALNASENVDMEVTVINAFGKAVKSLGNQSFGFGQQHLTINTNDLPNGIYFLQMANSNGKIVEKFTVIH